MEVGRQRQVKPASETESPSDQSASEASRHPIVEWATGVGRVLARRVSATVPHARQQRSTLTVRGIYEEYARFVWLTLQRMGVRPTDLDDMAHDVFVVVHRRLHTFDGSSRMTTWLFGICRRLAANYRRRRGHAKLEVPSGVRPNDQDSVQAPADEIMARREDRAVAEQILAKLPVEKRAVFVMFEIEGLSCQEIADVIGVPVGTVYSRLHSARHEVERALSQVFDAAAEAQRDK